MADRPIDQAQSLVEIAKYHNDVIDALRAFFNTLFHTRDHRFLGLTRSEYDKLLALRIEETELRSSLAIIAAIEAALHIDFQLRRKRRYKDPLSRAFRALRQSRKQDRPRLDEDLLDLWVRHHPECRGVISELKAALHFRHWLAHGRYWKRPSHRRFDFQTLYILGELIFQQLPLYQD